METRLAIRDRAYIEALERRIQELTHGLLEAIDVLEDEKLDTRAQRNALIKSDSIQEVYLRTWEGWT